MSNLVNHGLDKIPDAQGYLVINEDGAVISSAGDLENDENIAKIFVEMLQTAAMIPISGDKTQKFKRMSVHFGDFVLMTTVSNQRIFIVKRPAQQSNS